MELQEFLACMDRGERVAAGSEVHRYMCLLSQEALRLTAELNGGYHTPEEIREIMARLTGRPIDDTFSCSRPSTPTAART